MRRTGPPSEIGRLAAPLAAGLDAAWRRMHWWILAMALLYATSGITVIRPDEVAVVQRWGRLVGETPALQEHGPGLLFALPRPVDRVVRVKTKQVRQLSVVTFANTDPWGGGSDTLDPIAVGYALTGDQNIVHVEMTAHYRVRDAADWAFYGPDSETILRTEVSAAMLRSLGEVGVDHVLSDGRKQLIAAATRRAQAGLDAAHSGLDLVSLELVGLAPPRALASDFDAVQTAYIETETKKKEANASAQEAVSRAQAESNAAVQSARASAAQARARAEGDAAAFADIAREVHAQPDVVRERLYRDAVEKAIGTARDVRWIPPPVGPRYNGLRFVVASDKAGTRDAGTSTTGSTP